MKKNIFSNKYLMKIIYYGLLSMLLLFMILNQKLMNMDELWNFSFAKNIHDGLIPYKDFNLISTPLSCFINSIPLYLNLSLITFRITYFIYYVIILLLMDKILDKLKVTEFFKYLILSLIMLILVKLCYLDYNFVQIVFILTLILLHLKNLDYDNRKLNIIIPLIAGLTIVNKQSSGLAIAFGNIALILLNKYYFKKKLNYRFLFKEIILMLIPTIIFILYLLLTNSFNDFYDLAIVGLTTFSNKYIIKFLLIEMIIVYISLIVTIYLNNKQRELWILFVYSFASITFIIPILDKIHAAYAIIVPFIFTICIVNNIIKTIKINVNKSYTWILFPIFIVMLVININSYHKVNKSNTGIYKYIPTESSQQKTSSDVINYLTKASKDHDVYILDISATLFNLELGKYNKYFDMFMNGNFGIKGKKEIYSIIDSDNKIFMIDDITDNWQRPNDIIQYVEEQYDICGAIDYLTIYCKD